MIALFDPWQDSLFVKLLYPYLQFVLPLLASVAVVRLTRLIPLAAAAAVAVGEPIAVTFSWHSARFLHVARGEQFHDALIGAMMVFTLLGLVTARRWKPRRPGEPLIQRRFRQFSLATLFSVVTIAACLLAVGRYFTTDILQWLPLILVLAIMVNPFRVIGDWARGRARLQAVRARLRRHAGQMH